MRMLIYPIGDRRYGKQKTVSKAKEEPTKPKSGKKRRPKEQIDRVKEMGEMLAGIAGAIIALSSIRWSVSSQTVHDLWYFVTLNSRGLICRCNANAGGKMTAGTCLGFTGYWRKNGGRTGPERGLNQTAKDTVQVSQVSIRKCGALRQAQV